MTRSKYGNIKAEAFGLKFDSRLERDRYLVLRSMEAEGKITRLRTQPEYDLSVNGFPVCVYRADFAYHFKGYPVTEDSKGVLTPEFRIKRKLLKALTGIDIHIVTKSNLGELPHGK